MATLMQATDMSQNGNLMVKSVGRIAQIRVATLFRLASGEMLMLLVLLRRVVYLTRQSSLVASDVER